VFRIEDDIILGSLKVHEDRGQEEDTDERMVHIATHDLKFGDICTAK